MLTGFPLSIPLLCITALKIIEIFDDVFYKFVYIAGSFYDDTLLVSVSVEEEW